MPKIPLAPPFRDTDDTARKSGLSEAYDCVFDQVEDGFAASKRPGLWAWWKADVLPGIGCDGTYWWGNKRLFLSIIEGRGYAFSRPDAEPVEFTSSLVRFHIGQPVSFATNGHWLLACNGGPIIAWDGVNTAVMLQEPRHADSVDFTNSVFVANAQGTNNVRFTVPLLETETTQPEFLPYSFTPDANPDRLLSVRCGWSETLLFGPKSVEPWTYSGTSETSPFQRLSGAYIERGLGAVNTVVKFNNMWWWLDHEGKFVTSNGRSVQVVSSPFDKALRDLVRFDDAYAFVAHRRFIVICFPSSDQTFVYDGYNQGWSKWSWWNVDLNQRERFLGACAEFVPEWNAQMVGLRREGRVAIMHQNLVTDLYGPIRFQLTTSHLDFGTLKRKQSSELLLRLKRGF